MKKIILFFFPVYLFAQSVYLPPTHQVYKYLDKMEAKQVIVGYRDEVKPMTRETIARFLVQIDTTSHMITDVEQEEQYFYKEEFYQELVNVGYENVIEERWHPYQYKSTIGNFNFNVSGGYTYHARGDGKYTTVTSNGAFTYGYIGENVGTYFYFRDNHEAGSFRDPQRILSPIPAEVPSRTFAGRFFEYSTIETQVNIDAGFVTLSLEKMPNVWGSGERGTIILSNKPPSYPQIKLRAELGDNISFTYLHAWLFSDIIDSARSYQLPDIPPPTGFRRVNKQKYLAAHILEFTPWDGVDIAVGESQVYGNRDPELIYLIPVMFFKAAEHWGYDTDNSQLFLSLDLNLVPQYNFYLSLFIDEFSTEDFYRSDRQRNQLGFTVGTRAYDTFLPDTKLLIEYTRLNPWVYNHKYPEVTFQSHSVDMGHWLGQNADLLFVQGMYQPSRNLRLGFQLETWRKGGKLPTISQYRLPTPEFLYSPRTKSQSFGLVGNYEVVRDMNVDFQLLQSRYSSEVNAGATDYTAKLDAFIGIRYNMY
ncbi:MAG: hypothetical protein HYV29_08465 [Ignavibacteriales bacterium]|nr:hypothetical protein [Ignavibacteriales bacterium]